MKLHVRHTTQYRYTEPLRYTVQALHLWPASGAGQTVLEWHLHAPAGVAAQPDCVGNRVHAFSLVARPEDQVRELRVVAEGVVQTHGVAVFEDPPGLPPPLYFRRSTPQAEAHARLADWARTRLPAVVPGRLPTVDEAVALAAAVAERVRYAPGRTAVETTALEAFDWGLGVCQDQAHVMVAVCRSLGWPARYVSGYFYAEHEPELASHAWVDVCIDEGAARWASVDVTHRCLADERHIRLAAGTDYTACPPVRGVRRGGGDESMHVQVLIRPA